MVQDLEITLTEEQMEKLTNTLAFDFGFPYSFFGTDPRDSPNGTSNNMLLNCVAPLKFVNRP
jgi:hypothetical protein